MPLSKRRPLWVFLLGLSLAGCGPANAVAPSPHDEVATQKAQQVISQQEADYQKLRAKIVKGGGEQPNTGIDPVTGEPTAPAP